jgi:hypothetical protein
MAGLPQRKQQYREHDTFAINGKFIPVLLIFLSGWWITSSYGARLAEGVIQDLYSNGMGYNQMMFCWFIVHSGD